MSLYDYKVGRSISAADYPFYALIQAAMRQADTDNLEMLKDCWPEIWTELQARYNAPLGLLPGEKPEVDSPSEDEPPDCIPELDDEGAK